MPVAILQRQHRSAPGSRYPVLMAGACHRVRALRPTVRKTLSDLHRLSDTATVITPIMTAEHRHPWQDRGSVKQVTP